MEYNRFTSDVKRLIIGDMIVSCWKNLGKIRAEIPFTGMAFFSPEEQKSDMNFKIDVKEPDGSGKRLFGSENFMIPTFLYQRDNGEYDWITTNSDGSPRLSFHISEDWSEFTLYEDETDTKGERAFHEFGSLFSYAVLNHHACVLHGVVMEYQGKGILVMASSGTGKTTHTRMWRNHKNALILNGDRCLCKKVDGKWYAYGMPWSGSSGEYINRRVPISCLVDLRRGKTNYTEKVSLFDKTIFLMERIFAPMWPGKMQNEAFNLCDELASEIPMVRLYCRPDLESVEVLEKALEELWNE